MILRGLALVLLGTVDGLNLYAYARITSGNSLKDISELRATITLGMSWAYTGGPRCQRETHQPDTGPISCLFSWTWVYNQHTILQTKVTLQGCNVRSG